MAGCSSAFPPHLGTLQHDRRPHEARDDWQACMRLNARDQSWHASCFLRHCKKPPQEPCEVGALKHAMDLVLLRCRPRWLSLAP
eukprot:188965-Amphidinium_carterae.1